MKPQDFPFARIEWKPSYRLVPSRFPPRGLFDRVASPEDLDAAFAVESMTNDRLREEAGDIQLVPPDERMTGPGSTPIMAAFTHPNPLGSRFSQGVFGVFYAGRSLATAIRETVFHRERFLADSGQPPMTIEMREYRVNIHGTLRDLRNKKAASPLLDADSYAASRVFGAAARAAGDPGLVYPSVRDPGGECVAVFRTGPLSPARQGGHYSYLWNGETITDIVRLSDPRINPHA